MTKAPNRQETALNQMLAIDWLTVGFTSLVILGPDKLLVTSPLGTRLGVLCCNSDDYSTSSILKMINDWRRHDRRTMRFWILAGDSAAAGNLYHIEQDLSNGISYRVWTEKELRHYLKSAPKPIRLPHELIKPSTRKKRRTPSKRSAKSAFRPRENRDEALLMMAALKIQIETNLDELQSKKPNELNHSYEKELAQYGSLRTSIVGVENALQNLNRTKASEAAVSQAASSFSDGFQSWWKSDNRKICTSAATMSLFLAGTGISVLLGVGPPLAAIICGSLVSGGKAATTLLKLAKRPSSLT